MWFSGAVKFTKLTMYSKSELFSLFHFNLILSLVRLWANKPILTLYILASYLTIFFKVNYISAINTELPKDYFILRPWKKKTVPIKIWLNGLMTVQHSAWISYTIASSCFSCFEISLIYLRTFSNSSWLQLLITDMK